MRTNCWRKRGKGGEWLGGLVEVMVWVVGWAAWGVVCMEWQSGCVADDWHNRVDGEIAGGVTRPAAQPQSPQYTDQSVRIKNKEAS